MLKYLKYLVDLPDNNNADKRYEAAITFFYGILYFKNILRILFALKIR